MLYVNNISVELQKTCIHSPSKEDTSRSEQIKTPKSIYYHKSKYEKPFRGFNWVVVVGKQDDFCLLRRLLASM